MKNSFHFSAPNVFIRIQPSSMEMSNFGSTTSLLTSSATMNEDYHNEGIIRRLIKS